MEIPAVVAARHCTSVDTNGKWACQIWLCGKWWPWIPRFSQTRWGFGLWCKGEACCQVNSSWLSLGSLTLPGFFPVISCNQWEFQDPKMEVLYQVRAYFLGIFPYIGLIYGVMFPFHFGSIRLTPPRRLAMANTMPSRRWDSWGLAAKSNKPPS